MTNNSGNLELALRITADLKQGRQEIDHLGESLSDVGKTAAQANAELEGLGTQQPDTDGLQQIQRAAADISEGARHAEQSTARLRFAATGLMADMQALDEGLARSASGFEEIAAQEERLDRLMRAGALTEKEYQKALDTLDKQEAALIATRDRGEKALGALLTRYDPASAALRRLADDEKALEAALASGGLSLDRYNKAMNGLKVQRAQWQAQQDGAKGFADALEHLSLKSAGAQRELGILLKNAATGDWSMAQQNLMTLANRAGVMQALMNPAALAVGAVVAAVGVLAVAAYQGYQENERLNNAIIATGNYAGATAAGVRQMAQSWGVNNGEIGKTQIVLAGLIASGRLSGAALDSVGRAALAMSELTGRGADQVVADFAKMTDDAVRWAVETDRQYHFLTAAQLAHIQTLQRQGKEQEAAAEATRIFADMAGERLQRVYASLNPLESGWKSLTDTIKNSWQTLKDSFSDDPEKLRARLQWFIDQRTQLLAQGGKADASLLANDVFIQQWRQKQAELDRLIDKERQAARVEGERQEAEDRAKRALISIDNQRIQLQTKAEQKQSALNRLAQDYIDLWNGGRGKDSAVLQGVAFTNGQPAGGSYEVARQRIEAKYTDKPARDEESAYARLNRQITERIAALNAANASETRLTETQQFSEKMLATLADGTNRLTQAQQANIRARLQDLAGADRASQEKADAKTLGDVQTQTLRAIGDNTALVAAEIEQKWGDLIRRLNARGDQDGRALIQKLLSVEQAQRQVEAIQRRIQDVLAEQSRGEQRVQIQRQAGLIGEINARQQLVELNRQSAEQLQLIRPDLEALQSAPGEIGRKAGAALTALDTQTQQLRATTGLLSETLRKGFEEGLASALQGLADGTKSLQDAVLGLVQSVAGAMAQLAAQNLAQQATQGLSQLLGATNNDAAQTATTATNTAAQTANTTALATNTTAQAAAATALGTTASVAGTTTTAMAAATQAAAALTLALQTAAVAAAGNSTADTVGTVAKVAAAASGGLIRGPGTGTSDSIPAWLSNNEFVLRAAVVRQPGALDFLRAFNLRGMAALRFADGGPVGLPRISAPRAARFELAEPAVAMGGSGNVTVRQRLLPVLDDDLIADALRGPKGEELITLHISRNPSKFRSLLGK